METAITALIIIGVMILAITGVSSRSMSAQAVVMEASRTMLEREGDRMRTALTPVSATTSGGGDSVQLVLRNSGITRLGDLESWDVILNYADGAGGQRRWYSYGVETNQWNYRLFQNAASLSPEVFDPGLLNPGEEIMITVNISPPVEPGTSGLAAIAVANGVVATVGFAH